MKYIWITLLIITIICALYSLYSLYSLYLLYLGKNSCSKSCESFKPDFSDYNNIDRIQVDDKFAYCIGVEPTCDTGLPIKGGLYNNGNTYRSICDDGSNIQCKNMFYNKIDELKKNNYIWESPNEKKIKFSDTYIGFTEPTTYIPLVINDNNIILYDDKNSIIDTINKCLFLGLDENKCKKALNIPFTYADTSNNDVNAFNNVTGYNAPPDSIGEFFPSYTEKNAESKGFSGMYPGLPCIADYGASEGDNVCNGEIGLIEDESLVCPYYKPICSGYHCGSTFGKCTYSK